LASFKVSSLFYVLIHLHNNAKKPFTSTVSHLLVVSTFSTASVHFVTMETTSWLNQLIDPAHDTTLLLSVSLTTFLAIVLLFLVIRLFRSTDGPRLPPGPWSLPWLGHLLLIDADAPYETLQKLAHKYGPVYSVRLGGLFSVVVSDPKLVRQAFAQEAFSGRAPLYLTHGIMKGYGNY
jgi:hypothetical protein